jgi:hypothetical protein
MLNKDEIKEFIKLRSQHVPFLNTIDSINIVTPKNLNSKDATQKVFLCDNSNKNIYIVTLSNADFPHRVNDSESIKKQVCAGLQEIFSTVFLKALDQGYYEGLSYVVEPAKLSISENRLQRFIQKHLYARLILKWWLDVVRDTKKTMPATYIEHVVLPQVESLKNATDLPIDLKGFAQEGYAALKKHPHPLFFTFEHNDFRFQNIVIEPKFDFRFYVIDIDSMTLEGTPIYDLIHFSMSMNFSEKKFMSILNHLTNTLKCSVNDCKLYLLISLAHLYANLNCFPVQRFNQNALGKIKYFENSMRGIKQK